MNNGMRLLDINFTDIGPKKSVLPVFLQIFVRKKIFEP